VIDVPANELTQPPLSRLTPWERRSSHVPLTAPGTFVSAQVEEDKKGDTEVSLPNHRDQENNPTDVSSVTLACTELHGFCSLDCLPLLF
jgi:hypothetical protein